MGALRTLSVSQQVGLLFVTLFGLLTIVTIVAFTRSFRDRSDQQLADHEQFKRDLRAVWVGAVLFWVAWASGAFVSTLLFGLFYANYTAGWVTLNDIPGWAAQ